MYQPYSSKGWLLLQVMSLKRCERGLGAGTASGEKRKTLEKSRFGQSLCLYASCLGNLWQRALYRSVVFILNEGFKHYFPLFMIYHTVAAARWPLNGAHDHFSFRIPSIVPFPDPNDFRNHK